MPFDSKFGCLQEGRHREQCELLVRDPPDVVRCHLIRSKRLDPARKVREDLTCHYS